MNVTSRTSIAGNDLTEPRDGPVTAGSGFGEGRALALSAAPPTGDVAEETLPASTVTGEKERLEAAPGCDKDSTWPDFADTSWGTSIHEFYGHSPYWKR